MSKKFKQSRFPKELRIPPSQHTVSGMLQDARNLNHLAITISSEKKPEISMETENIKKFIADLGTGIWRLKRKMTDPLTKEPLEGMRKEYRYLESVWDILVNAGVEIQDHEKLRYDPGLLLKVVAFEENTSLPYDIVIQTIKPTIYYKKEHIQVGDVIVGTPDKVKSI